VHQITRGLAVELAPRVRVNTVAPGFVATPMTTAILEDPDQRRGVESRIPAGRVGRPADVASVVRFLLSDEASYITGEVVTIDGGLTSAGLR
jgi:NAD(P)-dependent dehydrogenase (short-subunit alcohol dehydrogenase family)